MVEPTGGVKGSLRAADDVHAASAERDHCGRAGSCPHAAPGRGVPAALLSELRPRRVCPHLDPLQVALQLQAE